MDRDTAKMCKLEHQQQYQQQIIINGVPQGGDSVQVPFLICPTCNNVIAQFNPGTSDIAVSLACEKELSQQIKYCVKCGQKLSFPSIIVLNPTDCWEVSENKNTN